jgi:hypothetical protein
MGRASKAIITTGILLMAISGCSSNVTKAVAIDQHMFNVPKRHLLEGTIPWLPASQHDGLMFYINPEAPLPDRNSVLIQSTATTCPPDVLRGSFPLGSACRAAAQREANEAEAELEKVHPNNDPTQWEYRVKTGKSQGVVVANCSAMADGNGLCNSSGNYGDLVYSVGLRDSEIGRLPEIRRRIHDLLSSWEKPAH